MGKIKTIKKILSMLGIVAAKLKIVRPRQVFIDYVPGSYVKEFDGWRGLGIFFVMLAHYFPSVFIGSWVFMEMFFVMSGFLISGILLDSKKKPHYLRKFMGRRVVRVFPVYYAFLILIFFVVPASWLDLDYYKENQLWFWLYAQNWLYSIEGWPLTKGLHHLWSLAIEEQFYIVWPFVVLLFSTKGFLRFCIFLFFFSIVFRNTGMEMGFVMPFPYVATLGRMEGLVLGAIIAILIRTDKRLLENYAYPVTVVSFIIMIILFAIAGTAMFQSPVHYMINYTIVDLFFAGLITMTLCSKELHSFKRLLNLPFFQTLGVLSYCLYLFHYPIQNIVETNLLAKFTTQFESYSIAKISCVGLAILITIPVVYAVHKAIELPFWKLRKYI